MEKQDYSKINQFFQGWYNLFLKSIDKLDEDKKQMAKERLVFCRDCEIRSGNFCSAFRTVNNIAGCGCYVYAKVTVRDAKCPLSKW